MKINQEKLPEKCEICHKSDCFDPSKNICGRCSGINTESFGIKTRITKKAVNPKIFQVATNSIFNKIQIIYLFVSFIPFLNLLKTFLVDDGYLLFISLSILSFLLGLVILLFSLIRGENFFIVLIATFFISLSPFYLLLPIGIISFHEIFFCITQLSKLRLTN